MRLGDLDELFDRIHSLMANDLEVFRAEVLGEINAAPTIDAVPVVRCKDCAIGDTDGKRIPGKVYCDHLDMMRGEDFFCAAGRKRDERSTKEASTHGTSVPDVEIVRHGHWIENRMNWVCSACGTEFTDELPFITHPNEMPIGCPKCRARMDAPRKKWSECDGA